MTIALFALLALVGLSLSALFSGLETGLYTINRVRLDVRAGRGDRRAIRVRAILERPTFMLSTLLIGNNVANYAGSYGIAAILDSMSVGAIEAVVINAGLLVPLLFVFGETLPKDLFRTHTDRWTYALSGFLLWTGRLLTCIGLNPIVNGFGMLVAKTLGADQAAARSARQRMSQLIKEGVGAGVLTESQTTLVERALALRDHTVEMEMVPFARVVTLPAGADRDALRAPARHVPTRLPVVDRSNRVTGIISTLDALLDTSRPLDEIATPPLVVPPDTSVRNALRVMRAERQPMAIVGEPGARPLGIVTIKDLVEPLTGELAAW